jgi:hypothetical protein
MTLPFNIPDKDKRKFQCFVCGMQYMNFPEFKEHILETHEEGREYVLCPLEHCKAPVRDMRMHFKVKHPQCATPKKGMMKALIWKDFSARGKGKGVVKGKPSTRKPRFREGYYESTKMKKSLHYRSGYESTIYECLDAWHEVVGFEVEPFVIPYIFQGVGHKYTPDVLVHYKDGHKEVWEIKPANQTTLERNTQKWRAAKQALESRGWDFIVMTEVGIDKLKKTVRSQFLPE